MVRRGLLHFRTRNKPIRRNLLRLIAALCLTALLSACSPSEALLWLVHRGDPQAQADRHELHYGDGLDDAEWDRYERLAEVVNVIIFLAVWQASEQASPEGAVRAAAREFGVSENLMVSIARCESGLVPTARNASSNALGLFQHLGSYWGARAAGMGYAYEDWSNATANARVSARMIAQGGTSPWNASRHCWG